MNQIVSTNNAVNETDYAFPNSQSIAGERLELLAQIFDPLSHSCFDRVPIQKGWSCWEIGAGYGTMACWLCERLGGTGRVLATDLEPRFLQPLARANLEVMRHDIVRDPCDSRRMEASAPRDQHLPERSSGQEPYGFF
jgi:tRNA A58 N-methylase Trm61